MRKIIGEKIPEEVINLIKERELSRDDNDFVLSDNIREKIISLGYELIDKNDSVEIRKVKESIKPKSSFLVLFGSGEISSVGRQVHDYVFEKIGKERIKIVIVSTPAGFQPNVKEVHEEIADFFKTSLSNYHPEVKIVYTNTKTVANDSDVLSPIDDADYIFMGPGSPTYAVKNLENTALLQKIKERVKSGASLSLSSAAVIAASKYTLPVYEIYKVGEKLHWEKGLNIFKELWGKEMSFIPHFNNTEGGEKNDTSRCYMGKKRFEMLLKLLPQEGSLTGIDEQTALVVDLNTREEKVMGKNNVVEITKFI